MGFAKSLMELIFELISVIFELMTFKLSICILKFLICIKSINCGSDLFGQIEIFSSTLRTFLFLVDHDNVIFLCLPCFIPSIAILSQLFIVQFLLNLIALIIFLLFNRNIFLVLFLFFFESQKDCI